MAETMGTFLLVDGKRSTMTIYFAPGNTVRKLYVVLLAIQGNHIVDGGFFTVVIANGRSRHDDLFTVNYSNRRSRAALCVCSVRTRYNFDMAPATCVCPYTL
jgi:hypothetical protein